jgi:acyl-CoA thioesterase
MDSVRELMARDRFAAHAGIELLEVSSGFARARMNLEPYHCNGVGMAQGGAIFTLADLAFAAACNSHGTVAVATNASISFMRPSSTGALIAEARELAHSRKLSHCTVRVADERGELVALFQGTAFRKRERVEEALDDPAASCPPANND